MNRMARPEGFEPPTVGTGNRCSIQLSYGRMQGEIIPDELQTFLIGSEK